MITKSKDDIITISMTVAFTVIIPVIFLVYGIFTDRHIEDVWIDTFYLILCLLIPLNGLLIYKMKLKAYITLSKDGITLSPHKGFYRSFAVMQRFSKTANQALLWQNIFGFHLIPGTEKRLSNAEGETHLATIYALGIILNDAKKTEISYDLRRLDKEYNEILALCNQFHEEYGNHAKKQVNA